MATTERVRISASVSSNGGSAITKWEWRFKGGAFGNYSPWHTVSHAVGNSMVYSAVAQAHGNTYTYQVRAVNAVGNGTSTEESIVVAGLPRSPPAATFTVTAGNASVTLAATTNDGGASISRWEYRQKAGSADYGSWQKVSGSAGTKLSTTVTSLTNGTTYRYQVRAVNSFGAGPASTEKSATPAVPAATVPAKPLIGLSSGGSGSFHIFGSSQGNGGSSITRWQRNYVSETYTRTWADWTTYSGGHDTPYGRRPVNRPGETFRVKIKACNARGCGPESDTKHILAGTNYLKPATPRNFTATARSGGVTLSANLPSDDGGATAAKWQYSYKTSGNYNSWQDIPNSWTESLSGRTVTGLTNGTTYTFRVRAHGHRNEQGPASNEVTVTPLATAPPKPTLSVAAGDGKVTLAASVANNGGAAVSKWQVARKLTPDANLGAWTDIPSSAGNSISGTEISGLTNHVSYTFAVRAVNSVGNSAQSSSVAVTPFGADSSPSFGAKTIGQRHFPLNSSASVTLPTATGGNGALTYEVTPALPAGLTFNAVTRTISGAATTAQSVGYYTYAVEDLDGDRVLLSFTIYVSEDLTPSFGTSTIADEYYTSATIPNKVLPAATSGNAPVTYTLSPALPQGLSFNASTRTISGTPAASQSSTSYTYRVTDGDGDTATLRFTIAVLLGAPPVPTVSITAGSDSATLQASVSSNGGSEITQWSFRARTGGAIWGNSTTVPGATGNSMVHTVTSLSRGSVYRFEVLAFNSAGSSGPGYAAIMVAGVPYKPPDATFTVTGGNASATLAATTKDGGASISRWEYRQKAGSGNYGSWQRVSKSAGTTFSTTVTGLTGNTTYAYQVRAVNSFGAGPASAEKSATPAATVPPKPDIGLSGADGNDFHLFGISRGNGGSAITGWQLHQTKTDGTWNSGWIAWTGYNGTDSSPYDRIDLARAGTFAVKVRVRNAIGWSPESDTKHITTGTRNIPPATPENFTATGGNASATLSVNLPSGDGGGTASGWQYSYKTTGNYGSWTDIPNSRTETLSGAVVTGLTNGTTYTFKVRAVGHRGEVSPDSAEATVTPTVAVATAPPKPTLSVAAGDGKVTLTASVANNGGASVSKWQVARKLTPDDALGAWTDIPSSAGNSITAKEVSGLTNHVSYTFAVRAVNSVGNSAQSSSVVVTPFAAESSPSFGSETIADMELVQTRSVSVTLPAATGGNGVLTYQLSPALPSGVTFNPATRTISGSPSALQSQADYTYTVRDTDNDTATLTFKLSVVANSTPSFGSETIADQSHEWNAAITDVTLPAVTGGNTPITYTLSPALPKGLSFDASTRVLSGTPTEKVSTTEYTYTATDYDDEAVSLTFDITVADTTAPTVVAASSGYYSDAGHSTGLSDYAPLGTDIHIKLTFSEDVAHTAGSGDSAKPVISYKIASEDAVQFSIVADTASLASGQCQPDAAAPADVYECYYRPTTGDNGTFDFSVGTGTEDTSSLALAATYTHATKLTVDTVLPTVVAADSGYYSDDALSDSLSGTVKTGEDIYIEVAFSEDMDHATGDVPNGRPFLAYKIGSAVAVDFDMVAAGTTLANGDCRPDATPPADVYECLYQPAAADGGEFAFTVGLGSDDVAGNSISAIYTHATKLTIQKTGPEVTAASSGYFEDAALTTVLTGPVNAGTDIYAKVAFSQNVKHSAGTGSSARPELSYSIAGGTPVRFHIVAHTATLASGQCRPDAATPADVYECRYTPSGTDSGNFDFRVGTGTQNTANESLIAAYTHTDKIAIDNTPPTLSSARVNASTLIVTFSENMDASASAKAANSAWDVEVGGTDRDVSSYTLSDATATLTLASAVSSTDTVTLAYNQPTGTANKLADLAGNLLATTADDAELSVSNNTGAPTVTAASSGYFSDAALSDSLGGPVKGGTDIYVKVVFSENVGQTLGSGSSARPEIKYKIGKAAEQQFGIVANTATLASGQCQPDTATPADVYECLYAAANTDSGDFDFRVGTGTQNTGGTALAVAYTHATKVEIDNTSPRVVAGSSGYYKDAALTTAVTHVKAGTDIYVKFTFSENMQHAEGDVDVASNILPFLAYDIGDGGAQFDVVGHDDALSSGDCRPDAAPPADVYECRYTVANDDSPDFRLVVGARIPDVAGNSLLTPSNRPYRHATKVVIDNTAPTLVAATVSGSALTLTFSEAMDESSGARADKSAFAVTVAGSGRTVSSYTLSGAKATLTLASAVTAGQSVTVAYTKPTGSNAKPLADLAGNELASFSNTLDTVAPTVTAASSGYFEDAGLTTPLTGPVGASTDIYVKVAFSEDVGHRESDTGTARPQISYQIGDATAVQFHIVADTASARQRRLPAGRRDRPRHLRMPIHHHQQRQRRLRVHRRHGDPGHGGQRARKRLHARQRGERGHHRADGVERRLLQRCGNVLPARRHGEERQRHLHQGDVQRKCRPHRRQRRQRPPGNPLQGRFQRRGAVRHRGQHRDAGERRLQARRRAARHELCVPLQGRRLGQRHAGLRSGHRDRRRGRQQAGVGLDAEHDADPRTRAGVQRDVHRQSDLRGQQRVRHAQAAGRHGRRQRHDADLQR